MAIPIACGGADHDADLDDAAARLLSRVLDELEDAPSYDDVLVRLCRTLCAAVPCDRSTVYLLSRRRNAFLAAADHGSPPDVTQLFADRPMAPGSFPGDDVVRAGAVLWGERGSAFAAFDALLEESRLHALALIPVLLGGEIEGVITCGRDRAPGFEARDVELVRRLGRRLGVVMRSSRQEMAAARLADRRTRLTRWGAALLAAGGSESMSDCLAAASRDLFHASGALLLLQQEGTLVPVGGSEDLPPPRIPLHLAAASTEVLRTRSVLVVNEYRRSAWGRPLADYRPPAAVLAAPLADEHGPLGVLAVYDLDEPFRFGGSDDEDVWLLATLAAAALRRNLLVQALTRANTAKNDFLASVSHDLRTPLNVIIGYSQLLVEGAFGALAAGQADTLARLLRTATEQLALIDDLLDLARIEQGDIGCNLEPVALADLVPSIRETMEALLHGRPVTLTVDVATDAVARTDRERLRQILVNLLTNASKFTPAGRIGLTASRVGDVVRLEVIDTGVGMTPEVQARACEPFVRGRDPGAGSGLGLAIVARLLRVLRGTLTITSVPGGGTTVRVELPAMRAPPVPGAGD